MLFVEVILPVFLIILCGFVLEKRAKLDFRTLTDASLYLFSPALVFAALMKRPIEFALAADLLLFMLLYSGGLLLLALVLGRALKMAPETGRALALTTVMMNVGNFGLPLAFFAFGEAGLEYSVLTFVIFNIPLSTLAILLAQRTGVRLLPALGNMLRIPIFHAMTAALLLQIIEVELADFLFRPIELLGQAAIPLMLVLLGMQLARTRLVTEPGFLLLASVIRLGLAPLLAWWLTGWIGMDGLARKVAILQTSTPSAVLPLLYSLRFGTRPDLVSGAIFVSTLLSAATLSILLWLL